MKSFSLRIYLFVFLIEWSSALVVLGDPSAHGVDNDTKIDRFIDKHYPNDDLTANEVVNAVYMYNSILTENNNRSLVKVLKRIVATRTLPKGAWIRLWRDQEKSHEMWILELNRHKQPNDVLPEPGNVDLLVRVPLRVIHTKKLLKLEVGE